MFGKDETPETRLKQQFWKELHDDRTVMLGLEGVEDDRTRPMTAQVDVPEGASKEDGGTIYFFASRSEGIGADLDEGAKAVATFVSKGHGLFASIHGTLADATDPALVEKLWNPFVASWYKDGKTDPELILIRFDAREAQIWEAATGATLKAAALKWLFDKDPGKDQQREHVAEVQL
ncbi:pyridoxamine 5'-phosphate oxidase family protein [Sphingomonas sp. ASV193]|uniref:pyridoxamine 5'-phosphate oxidase family protein n=1 Tax=Sphingomonas sp. ASV193 TaxID=3144405 RepID=UPI0032E9050F